MHLMRTIWILVKYFLSLTSLISGIWVIVCAQHCGIKFNRFFRVSEKLYLSIPHKVISKYCNRSAFCIAAMPA